MKKILLIITISLLFCGCATTTFPLKREIVSFSDFRPYADDGFFISPGMGSVKYKPIGILKITFVPGVLKKSTTNYPVYSEDAFDQYGHRKETHKKDVVDAGGFRTKNNNSDNIGSKDELNFFQPDEAYMIARIVEYAKALGATGAFNYKVDYNYIIPSQISKLIDGSDPYVVLQPHPNQTYGDATVSAFAVEIINE